ncbi:MAG: hypothetical protein A2176_05630 [Spirochaetes bacterium RBG_13_51_14]|nr:MAG: hypothetical protein A2176_05630 [Spirochaetes bacterium RBG_13_51_14]
MKKIIIIGMFLSSIIVAYFYGLVSHKYYLPPFPQLLNLKNRIFPLSIGYSDTSSRREIACGQIKGGRVMVALVFGQSNSGNHGETMYKPEKPVYSFFRGRCYEAEDPLPGATGDSGSVWSRMGDLLISRNLYDAVVFIPIGVGTTTIDQWTAGGYLNPRITNAVRESRAAGMEITHLFWVQGGSEKRTSGDVENKNNYKKNFMTMLRAIRDRGVNAPIYVAVATYNDTGCIKDIQDAQAELVDPATGIYAGANNDLLYRDEKNRWERVHLSHRGLDLCAGEWLAAIRKAEGR